MSRVAGTPIPSRAARWLALIKEALAGSRQDFTAISIDRAIVLLAIPMVLEMAMESLFGVVDIFFVAHLGADATATVGITEGMLVMVFAVAIGLSMGTTAVVARRTGEHDQSGAAHAAVQSILLGFLVSILIFAVCFPLAPKFLALMGASPAILSGGSTYTRIMLSSSGIILMLFLMNAIFRGAGDAAVAMRVLWLANFINICLDPCLILGLGPFPRLGVTGAAVSTTIGRSIGILYQVYILSKRSGRIRILREHLRLHGQVMLNILRIGATGTLQFLIVTASWLFMVRMVQSFGSAVTAGYTVAIRIIIFSILPSWGLGSAAATLVGQNLGAREPDRAERSVRRACFFNMIFLGIVCAVFLLFAPGLVRIFSPDPQVVRYGADCLRIVSLSYILYAYGLVILQAFNGAGDTWTPSILNFIAYWVVQLPLGYLLGLHYRFGPNGIYTAVFIADILLSVLCILFFRRGKWKLKMV